MASPLHRLHVTALRSTYRVRPRRCCRQSLPQSFAIHTTHILYNKRPFPPTSTSIPSSAEKAPDEQYTRTEEDCYSNVKVPLNAEEEQLFERLESELTPSEQALLDSWKARAESYSNSMANEFLSEEEPDLPEPQEKFKPGLMAMGEEDPIDVGEDEIFEGDDITSLGHGELEQHRELREYARIVAWEMPLLSKFAKPFQPPDASYPLRFRYTDYMGETHPAAKKVVLEFCTNDLTLLPSQRLKLIKLLGPRYNPQKDSVRMSSEMFETQAQNKRYLGDLLDTLLVEAKGEGDSETAKDTFEDVPVDFRHVKWKSKLVFPEAWKMKAWRREQLDVKNEGEAKAEMMRIEAGAIVDGVALIERAVRQRSTADGIRVAVEAPRVKKGQVARKAFAGR